MAQILFGPAGTDTALAVGSVVRLRRRRRLSAGTVPAGARRRAERRRHALGLQFERQRLVSSLAQRRESPLNQGEAIQGLVRFGSRESADNDGVQIRIEATDLPGRSCGPSPDRPGGYHNVHVGVQRRRRPDDLLDLVPGDAPSATWTLECTVMSMPTGTDLRGPYIQGSPGVRFIYLSWGTVDDDKNFTLFRRAKLWLDAIPPDVLNDARKVGLLVGRLGLTDRKGNPLCAAVRPPLIKWVAAHADSTVPQDSDTEAAAEERPSAVVVYACQSG